MKSLRADLAGLRRSREKVFQAPSAEWIEKRLDELQEVLKRTTKRSAPVLRRILGPIRLQPTRGDIGK